MKKLFLFATAAVVLCSCSNQPKYIIDGDIYDADAIFSVLTSPSRDTELFEGDKY